MLCDSGIPVAFAVAYVLSVNVSFTTGALSTTVHVRPVPDAGVQIDDPGARFAMTGVPPLTAIDADCVFSEMYCGFRRTAPVVVAFAGIAIDTDTLCGVSGAPAVDCGWGSEPLPP